MFVPISARTALSVVCALPVAAGAGLCPAGGPLRMSGAPRKRRGLVGEPGVPPRRNWIQEERRRTLGDWVAFCPGCGHVARYFEEHEDERQTVCPQCATTLVARCPACDARLPSAFQVECEDCGAELRPKELFGGAIRRQGR